MAENWLMKMVKQWNNEIHWTQNESVYLADLLSSLCENNNGTLYYDVKISDQAAIDYKKKRLNDILNSHVAGIIKEYLLKHTPVFHIDSEKFSVKLPFIEPKEHKSRVSLNLATPEELEKLPGIGKKTAARIVSYRRNNGGVKRINELKTVKGISDKEIRKFAHMVYLKIPKSVSIRHEHLDGLISNPTFENYISFIKDTGFFISRFCRATADIKELIIKEIEGIKNNLELQPKIHGYSPGIRASKLKNRINEFKELQDYIDENKVLDTHGVLLRDATYYYFIIKLLKLAKKKIRLIMFYFAFQDEEKHPSDIFMDEIIKAKERGVDIKIILDHQDEFDPKPSRIINEEAYKYLQKSGIPITFDTEEIATHTKLLLVDDDNVIIGSHNWTAGSFFIYRDTSVYINSPKLADYYYSHFDSLWKTYQE